MPAQKDNPDGFWEALPVVRLNDRLLALAGGRWDRLPLWLDSETLSPQSLGEWCARSFADASLAAWEEAFGDVEGDIVCKDPRLSLTLPLWLQTAEAKGFAPEVLMTHRAPAAIIASLTRRNGLEFAEAADLVTDYWVQMLANAPENAGVVSYEQLASDPVGTLTMLGFAMASQEATEDVRAFVKERSTNTPVAPIPASFLPTPLRILDEVLASAHKIPRSEDAVPLLREVKRERESHKRYAGHTYLLPRPEAQRAFRACPTTGTEMSKQIPSIPQSACAYEIYDPVTLEPQNESTFIRLMELGWNEAEFNGRTVLDIGANTGILSLRAHQLGATSILSIDVQVPLIEFFRDVVQRHNLPVRVERKGFFELDPAQHAADVVFFMEVLHWIVDQGGSVIDAISHLAQLTHETLYLETPWDIKEPSIARKGVVTETQYNIELIIRELSRYFAEVRILRFMTYFGKMKDSKRVLIRASQRRPASSPLGALNDANLLDISMMRGANTVELVTTPNGPKVLKRLPPTCTLARLDDEGVSSLSEFIAGSAKSTLVAPERIDSGFRLKASDGAYYMLFPFVGHLGDFFPRRKTPSKVSSPIDVALAVREELRSAPPDLIEAVRAVSPPMPLGDVDTLTGDLAAEIARIDMTSFCRSAF
ncbi:methyltransferase domain-containing protein, partial [Nisaea sp.]